MAAPEPAFWENKRVLVTGHTGFKGAWLSMWLLHMGAKVYGFARPPDTEPNAFSCCELEKKLTSETGDINNLAALEASIERSRPDIIFHLAAQSLVRESYRNPVETFQSNVLGTVNLLEAARRCGTVKAVVVVTTDKCYENREWVWGYRETDRLGGHDPYSASKACTEIVTQSYRASYQTDPDASDYCAIATARAGNVIGGGDWSADRLVPDIVRAFTAGESLEIRYPNAVRPWQHVLEPLCGYLQLAENLYSDGSVFSEAWNFGPDETGHHTVGWIADNIARNWQQGATWHETGQSHPHEASMLSLDCTKARQLLGWKPVWTLEQSLSKVIHWYQAQANGENMFEWSNREIEQYLEDGTAGAHNSERERTL